MAHGRVPLQILFEPFTKVSDAAICDMAKARRSGSGRAQHSWVFLRAV